MFTRKLFFTFLILFAVLIVRFSGAGAETYFGTVTTGLLDLSDLKYPTYLFIPEHYQGRNPFGLLIYLPENTNHLEAHIQKWVSVAERESLIVLTPGIKPRPGDIPYRSDEWLIQLKKEVQGRYHIHPSRVFLVGSGDGAHYAAYLGLAYPSEFSAAALLNGSWAGPFERLLAPKSRPEDQLPFFVVLDKQYPGIEAAKKRADELAAVGYPLHWEETEKGDEVFFSRSFQQRMFEWLIEKRESWNVVIDRNRQTTKEKVRGWLHRNVVVS